MKCAFNITFWLFVFAVGTLQVACVADPWPEPDEVTSPAPDEPDQPVGDFEPEREGDRSAADNEATKTADDADAWVVAGRQRGPQHAHKLTDVVMEYVCAAQSEDATLRAPALVALVRKRFGIEVHPRSLERALARQSKKGL